jgi:hypothetical protein
MNFTLHVLDVRGKGVQVVTPGSTSEAFWLPRGSPVVWSEAPEPGAKVSASIPRWLAQRHHQFVALRGQYSILFHQKAELDPEKAKGPIPMANDRPEDAGRGALFKNDKKEKPSHPRLPRRHHDRWR